MLNKLDKHKQIFYNLNGGNMEKQILHVDVNNAFLSWTAVDMLKHGSKIDIVCLFVDLSCLFQPVETMAFSL